jgi:hypothetical protein
MTARRSISRGAVDGTSQRAVCGPLVMRPTCRNRKYVSVQDQTAQMLVPTGVKQRDKYTSQPIGVNSYRSAGINGSLIDHCITSASLSPLCSASECAEANAILSAVIDITKDVHLLNRSSRKLRKDTATNPQRGIHKLGNARRLTLRKKCVVSHADLNRTYYKQNGRWMQHRKGRKSVK